MPKPISLRKVLRVLNDKGFIFISQKGSHAKYRKIGNSSKSAIIKMGRKEIPYGTFKSILRQANLAGDDFKN